MQTLYSLGQYWMFIASLFAKPEKFAVYRRQIVVELDAIGTSSVGIAAIVSIFMGAVITIQTSYNLVNPLIPRYIIGLVARDSIIIEFAPTIISLVMAGKVGSSICSQIGTMRVSEQIDALEIMGINSSGYLVVPKMVAAILIMPFLIIMSMALGIAGGWAGGVLSGVISSPEFIRGIQYEFIPFNVTFAIVKTVVFAFIITSVSAYQGFYVKGGSLEVGQASTRAVVYSSILILFFDYVLTQLMLA